MTLHAFSGDNASAIEPSLRNRGTYELTRLSTALNICHELLLLLLELCTLPVQLPLRLRQCALVLPQPFRRSYCPAEEGLLQTS